MRLFMVVLALLFAVPTFADPCPCPCPPKKVTRVVKRKPRPKVVQTVTRDTVLVTTTIPCPPAVPCPPPRVVRTPPVRVVKYMPPPPSKAPLLTLALRLENRWDRVEAFDSQCRVCEETESQFTGSAVGYWHLTPRVKLFGSAGLNFDTTEPTYAIGAEAVVWRKLR